MALQPRENFKCKHCKNDVTFTNFHNYRSHLLARHIAPYRFICKYCHFGCWSESLLKLHHLRSAHSHLPFEPLINKKLEAKLTPEFWLNEYGIPISKSLKFAKGMTVVIHRDKCIFKTKGAFKLHTHKGDFSKPALMAIEDIPMEKDKYESALHFTVESKPISPTTGPSSSSSSGENRNDGSPIRSASVLKQNIYKCLHCKKIRFTANGMRQHWYNYHNGHSKELECSYYQFKSFTDTFQVVPDRNLACTYCCHYENSIAGMRSHHNLQHPGKRFRMKRRELPDIESVLVCDLCGFRGLKFTKIKKHFLKEHPEQLPVFTRVELHPERICYPMGNLIEDKVMYGCPICRWDFPSPTSFRQHILFRDNHENCEPTVMYNRWVIQENVEIPHDDPVEVLLDSSDAFLVYKCPSCDYETKDKNVLIQNHLATHIKAFICPICDHDFQTSLDAGFHMLHYHKEKIEVPVSNRSAYKDFIALKNRIQVESRNYNVMYNLSVVSQIISTS